MSLNSSSSSSSNGSLLQTDGSLGPDFNKYCLLTKPNSLIYMAYCITNTLLSLPLSVSVLRLGFRRWRRQRSAAPAAATTTHSDCFAYHVAVVELIGVLGCVICSCGIVEDHLDAYFAGVYLWSFSYYGETFFHVLTCVERYLAVVHPVTYLSLRRERGTRMRNVTIGGVWLLCVGATCLLVLDDVATISDICILASSFIVTSFCSLSVLCALIRPGPGKQAADRERVDQSKRRAFYTITAILAVLLLRGIWSLAWAFLYLLTGNRECVTMTAGVWFYLPSSLVLPLLFLHRAGVLACCKGSNKRG